MHVLDSLGIYISASMMYAALCIKMDDNDGDECTKR